MHKESDSRWEAGMHELRDIMSRLSEAVIVTSVRDNQHENGLKEHKERLESMERSAVRTERNLAEANEKLNTLIAMVDGMIRDGKNGPQ